MSPDQRLSPVSPEEARKLPEMLGLTAVMAEKGVFLYNPAKNPLLAMDPGRLGTTEMGVKLGLSPKKPFFGIVGGWEVSAKPSTDSPRYQRNIYVKHYPMVSKEEENLCFKKLWLFRNGKVEEISPRDSDSTVYKEQEVAFIPVPSQSGKDGGVLMVPVNDLLKPHFRMLIESFLRPRQSR